VSPETRQRFERLLLSLPEWKRKKERLELLGALDSYGIASEIEVSGSATQAAGRFLDLYTKHGAGPYRALLRTLRDDSVPGRNQEIDALERALRARWDGDPYPGLLSFDHHQSPIYFGREKETDDLLRTVESRRFTAVTGPSGSGKSSLVRAGLWGRLAGDKGWLITAMIPELPKLKDALYYSVTAALGQGYDRRTLYKKFEELPLAEFAEHVLKPGARWLLILDQMEELFSTELKKDGVQLINDLLKATRESSRVHVVATLRADFQRFCYTREYEGLTEAMRDGGWFPLLPPGRAALERMVSGPVNEVDLQTRCSIDPALPGVIAADAEREAGGLALMAFALQELYTRCSQQVNPCLDVATYRDKSFGGLSGCIARRADAAMRGFDEATLYRVFASLVRATRDDAPTRRRAPLDTWKDDAEEKRLVDAFDKARLLVADQSYEVAHEALLREWPKLAEWIEQRREAFGLLDRVRADAHDWMSGDASRRHRRPLSMERIEEIRAMLEKTGLLAEALKSPDVARLLTRELDWILYELGVDSTPDFRRGEIGVRLAEIGDPRPGVGVIEGVPDIVWCPIPAGPKSKAFEMAKYPITFAQFRAFLDAAVGYREAREPEQVWTTGLANHPVTDVSWHDANAFCKWLSARLKYKVRLPHEDEWQWAAQSAQAGFTFPWGNDPVPGRANTWESDLKRLSAVGMFPRGESRQEVCDLAGNVWEWCSNQYKEGGEERVLRGGSWDYNSQSARADSRSGFLPYDRYNNIGFRVVRSAPIAGH